jgi:hypothetical protein
MDDIRSVLIAEVERELAEFDAADAQVHAGLAQRTRRGQRGASFVYSVRLDRGEVAALERRAAVVGLKPSVLARNLIRAGLGRRADADLAAALGRAEDALTELRALLG